MPWVGGIYRKSNYATNGWTGDAANNIGIEAGRHDTQDDDFASGISQCLNKDGSNTATGNLNFGGSYKLTNLIPGTASTDSATYGQVLSAASGATAPSGVIMMYGAASAPAGFLLCDGTAVSRTSYAALFAIIGTTYGAGNGTTTFNVPDFQQRFPLGKAAAGTGSTLGSTGGAIDHTHNTKAHYHGLGTLATTTTNSGHGHSHTLAVTSTNSGHGHGLGTLTMQPAGAHFHTVNTATTTKATANTGGFSVRENGTSNTSTQPDHTHALTGSIGGSDGLHTHDLTGGVGGADGAHTHVMSGFVGNTSAVNGDIDQATTAQNPPYLVVNYIIKT